MNEKKPIPSVFEEEYSNLKRFKDNIENGNLSFEDLQREYVGMGKAYESLLRLSNKLLKIGDSTQRHLVRTKEELKTTNDELEAAFKNLKALSQIGQSITSTLETREIIFSVYNYIKTIMSVDILAIGMFEPDKNIVKYRICIKDNEFLPSLVKDSLDEDNLSAMCFHKEGEVIIRNVDAEYPQYVDGLISQWGEKTVSQAYFPLKVEKRFIGVLALLTYQKCRIRETDLDILHSMSSYIGIAIDNANAYRDIKRKNAQLKTNLEKINELNENLGKEQEKSERLLLNILPEKIAKRLKSGEGVIADHFSDAIVLFADIAGFTVMSSKIASPDELVKILNEIFTRFDGIANHYQLEKIKTIGDCYMMAGGIPEPGAECAARMANAALEMIEEFVSLKQELQLDVNLRVGIHAGSVVAGVIGKNKFVYDLWGDTVNTASRMESHGMPGRVHCSEAAFLRLKDSFHFEDRGVIEVKGKGPMHTYFLLGKK